MTILDKYYDCIVQQMKTEFTLINDDIEHAGEKGKTNEIILRDLLIKFLPKRFGIGTGIIVDQNGKQSKQCDIIIYDTLQYPSLLGLASVQLFPVDIVYAVIEIKTTFNKEKAEQALNNIRSVKELDFMKKPFISIVSPRHSQEFAQSCSIKPTPPLGFIFAYRTTTESFETFVNWFNMEHRDYFPELISSLDQGVILKPLGKSNGELSPVKKWCFPLLNEQKSAFIMPENKPENINDYPVKKFKEKKYFIDDGKTFLVFLIQMFYFLNHKRLNSNIPIKDYFKEQFETGYLELKEKLF